MGIFIKSKRVLSLNVPNLPLQFLRPSEVIAQQLFSHKIQHYAVYGGC